MRPIDADKLKEHIRQEIVRYYTCGTGGYMLAEDAIEDIDIFPTLDVVPREEFEALQRRYDLAVAERVATAKALVDANIDLDAMRGAANSLKMHYENVKRETVGEIFALVWDAYQTTHDDAEFGERLDKIEKKYTED